MESQYSTRRTNSGGLGTSLQQVLEKHSEVFKEGLGELRGVKSKLYIDKDERPRYFPARHVPFSIRERVKEELEQLQALGVIQQVQFADWAAPIVPVLQSDGRVRICGDYKITVNRAARLDKYPIPRIVGAVRLACTWEVLHETGPLTHVPADTTRRGIPPFRDH